VLVLLYVGQTIINEAISPTCIALSMTFLNIDGLSGVPKIVVSLLHPP